MRRYLARSFQIDTIVTSHDPERIYFSENTRIGEMLVVCRRAPEDQRSPTRVINLAVNPATPTDAIGLYFSIQTGELQERGHGTVQSWPASRIEAGDWGAVQFLSPYLCESFIELCSGSKFPITKLGDIAEIGPAGQAVRETFNRSKMPDSRGMTALWYHDATIRKTLNANTDSHVVPKRTAKGDPDKLWEKRGRLLLPTHLSLPTIRMLALRLDLPALGSLWVPCNPKIDGVEVEVLEKALCVYINSSIGALAVLGNRTNKTLRYPTLAIHDMRSIPVPDFNTMPMAAVNDMAEAFDASVNSPFGLLREMDVCESRLALDIAVTNALGIDPEDMALVRKAVSSEPCITEARYTTQA